MTAHAPLAKKRVLVLNRNWQPYRTESLEKAITLLFKQHRDGTPKALIIDAASYETFTWADWSRLKPIEGEDKIVSVNAEFKVPEVILLCKCDRTPKPKATFTRRSLYKRDKYTCQYCGKQPGSEDLTIDHVHPRSRGGLTTWENCVLSCGDCNRRKADKLLKDCGMKLLKEPSKPPATATNFHAPRKIDSWSRFVSECYWSIELENDNK